MRLIEPLGLLDGSEGEAAVSAGLALPLCGGRLSYTLARLIGPGEDRLVPAGDLPGHWLPVANRLAAVLPDWAGIGPEPAVMGILNVTPDSFSDGGDWMNPETAIAAGHAMQAAGAALLDIGGESTRPGAAPLLPAVEQARILQAVRALAAGGAIVSVDTRNAATMDAALAAGARIVNDVSALAHDAEAAAVVASRRCPVILMHMRGTPATMDQHAIYRDVGVEVVQELATRIEIAVAAGIDWSRIAVDPGIGFAKTGGENLELLSRLPLLLNLGCRLVVGVSRKRFIGRVAGVAAAKDRGPGSISAGMFAIGRGGSVLRVHDVAETVQAVRVRVALAQRPGIEA